VLGFDLGIRDTDNDSSTTDGGSIPSPASGFDTSTSSSGDEQGLDDPDLGEHELPDLLPIPSQSPRASNARGRELYSGLTDTPAVANPTRTTFMELCGAYDAIATECPGWYLARRDSVHQLHHGLRRTVWSPILRCMITGAVTPDPSRRAQVTHTSRITHSGAAFKPDQLLEHFALQRKHPPDSLGGRSEPGHARFS